MTGACSGAQFIDEERYANGEHLGTPLRRRYVQDNARLRLLMNDDFRIRNDALIRRRTVCNDLCVFDCCCFARCCHGHHELRIRNPCLCLCNHHLCCPCYLRCTERLGDWWDSTVMLRIRGVIFWVATIIHLLLIAVRCFNLFI